MAGKKGEFSLEIRAEELGLDLEMLAGESERAFREAISSVANATYAHIVAKAQQKLKTTRQDYLAGLKFSQIGKDSYLISLDTEWANMLEEGFSGEKMKEQMLSSEAIVTQGRRAGQKWVRKAKAGHKYAAVPFGHKPGAVGSDIHQAMKALLAPNSQGGMQRLTKVFKDINGQPIDSGAGAASRPVARVTDVSGLDDLMANRMQGMVKYQRVVKDKSGKSKVQSIYQTYRTVSEIGKTWKGYDGLHAFADAETYVAAQIDKILKSFLG